ncbi:MAG: glycosyltransferase [Verrucomicrobiota bacterium]
MDQRICPRIIQTARSRDLPLLARAVVANLRSLNPGFEYQFFDDEDVNAFIRNEFPQHREIFEGFPFRIQKYDFFRYLAVFRLGGFYFDTDVFLAEGLDELCLHSCVLPFEELTLSRYLRRRCAMDWEIGNYAFGAEAGHPFLDAVIQNCVRAQRDPAWVKPMLKGIPHLFRSEFYVLNTTGPGLLSRTLAENPNLAQDVTVLFPEDVCDDRSWHQFGKFGVHAMEGSWRTRSGYLRRRLGNLWEAWVSRRGMAESRRLGKTRAFVGNAVKGTAVEWRVSVRCSAGVSPASPGRVPPPAANGHPGETPALP